MIIKCLQKFHQYKMNNLSKNKRKNCKMILEKITIKVKKLKKMKSNNKI